MTDAAEGTSPSNLLDALPGAVALVDSAGVIGAANRRFAEQVGYSVSELTELPVATFVTSMVDLAKVAGKALTAVARDGREITLNVAPRRRALGTTSWWIVQVHADAPEVADPLHLTLGHAVDAETEAALALSEQRFRLAFEGNMAPMVFSDQNGLFLAVNDEYCKMTGRSNAELVGRDSKHFTYPEDIGVTEDVYRRIESGEIDDVRYGKRFVHTNGRIVSAEVSMRPARDEEGKILYFISSVRDVTEERTLAAQLSHQALHDPLTGLANRALFDDRLEQAHARITRQGGFGAVLLLDLDDFKGVNDAYGHLVGDQLLVTLAGRFESVTRSTDTLCRFGGDEFLYLAEGLATKTEAEQVARRLLDALHDPFDFDGIRLEQRASVGIVIWDGTNMNNVDLVQNADAAMYEAKRKGHGHVVVFTPDMRKEAVSRFALAQELRQAISNGELRMHYQPIIDLETTDVVGFEALMRWNHPERGWIPPDVFIELAEQSELIFDIGAFALHESVAAATSWTREGTRAGSPYVTVNLSARQFHDPGLVPMITRELDLCGLEPERLVLEVTEIVALVDISQTMRIMEELHRLRIGVALDDFGTGYSSLSYLAALKPKIVKIDQSFVRPQRDLERSDTLLEAIITLGNKLEMTVLAAGVETEAQLDRLHNLDCELGQGFLWSPAVPVDEATTMLNQVMIV